MNTYVDVILPLPLNRVFTYSIPLHFANEVFIGSRIIVQFGKKKFYTAIVTNMHNNTPQTYSTKDIYAILDSKPIVTTIQLKLWHWLASYYMCSIGEVYKAAIPSGLKIESETIVSANDDFEEDETNRLKEKESVILDLVASKEKLSISEIERISGYNNILPVIKSLLEKEALLITEQLKKSYKVKFERCVRLTIPRNDQDKLRTTFDELERSKKQFKLLLKYLDLSGYMQKGELKEVTKRDLIEKADVSNAVIKALTDKGILEIYQRELSRLDVSQVDKEPLKMLNDAQQTALKEIDESFENKDVVLFHGVTSSGKTEVYMHLIEEVVARGEQVLFMVPEIALTTQLTERLKKVFGDKLAIYHSKFTDNERVEIWNTLLNENSIQIVIGVRSSLFLPFRNLGLVIIDEEHEATYKQQDPAPRYNGRNAAMVLSAFHNGKTLLGSATPSIESFYNAKIGKYGYVELTTRHENVELPFVHAVDLRKERAEKTMLSHFSKPLASGIRRNIENGSQTIIFQNRRGFAPMVECSMCGWVPRCEHCDVSLTYHKSSKSLSCHYCGYSIVMPDACPSCSNHSIESLGLGTEKIEEEITTLFKGAKVSRMDLDTTRTKKAYENIIKEFQENNTNILVGTQMISKGLDFHNVSLVGIINADMIMNYPDFRAHERAFQMMVQVAGRAGRRLQRGEVIIQTSSPELPLIKQIMHSDYNGMYETQISERHRFCYPPFYRLIYIYMKHRNEKVVHNRSMMYARYLKSIFGDRVLGPDNPPVARIQSMFIRKIVIKIENEASIKKAKEILMKSKEDLALNPDYKSLIIYFDVDPV